MKRHISEYATDVKLHLIAQGRSKEYCVSAIARIDKAIEYYNRGMITKVEVMETLTRIFREVMSNDEN